VYEVNFSCFTAGHGVGCSSSGIRPMSVIEWPGRWKWERTAPVYVALAWRRLFVACLCSEKRLRSVRLVSPTYCFLHFLHSVIYVKVVELQVIWCLICLVSPVLLKVYDILPFWIKAQVRHPCFESQWNVPAGSLGVLLVFAGLARTSRSRRLGERRKATTGTSLKMFFKRSVECRIGCFLRRISGMLGKTGS